MFLKTLAKKLAQASVPAYMVRLAAAALLCAVPALAGATGFSGKVTGGDGTTPLNGVKVEVVNPVNDSIVTSVFTATDGNYSFGALSPGVYHIQAALTGFFPSVRSSHTVLAGADIKVNFALQSTGAEAWRDDFSVTASPASGWNVHIGSPPSFASNGNVMNFQKGGGAGYVSITKSLGGSFSNVTYPLVSFRNKWTLISGIQSGNNPPDLIQDRDSGWNIRNDMVASPNQTWPWQERTYPVTVASWANILLLNEGDPYVADHFIDYIIIHSRDRGFVSGQVRNLSGTPLPHSRVQVRRGTAVVGEALSDAAGNYTVWVATETGGYDVYFSTNGTAEYLQSNLAVYGRSQTTVDINIDTAPPAAVTSLGFGEIGLDSVRLTWTAPGDDLYSGQLNSAAFAIQHSTDPLQAWSPQAAQINISTWGVNPFTNQNTQVYGLPVNTTSYFRLWTRDAYGSYSALSNGATAVTLIESPSHVYIDEVSSWSITASVYGSSFTNLGEGLSGADLALDNAWTNVWTANGGRWTELPAVPWVKRAQAAAAALNGHIYLVGGLSNGSPVTGTQTNYRYSPQGASWSQRGILNVSRYGLSAAALGGKLYAVGGLNVGGVSQQVNEAYDPATNTWSTLAPMPTARSGFGLAALRGRLYAVGGDDGAGYNKTEVYEPVSNTWSAETNLPTPRWGLALAAAGNRLYAVGGYKPTLGYSDDNEEYNPDTKTWTPRPRLPAARRNLAAAAAGGKLYFMGGYDGASLQNRVDAYGTQYNTWFSAAPLPAARENAAAAALDGKIYLLGGFDGVELASATVYNTGLTKVFTGLQPNRQYSLQGKVRNQAGQESGQFGGPQTYTLAYATVPEGGLSPFTNVNDGSLTVRWSSGSVAGGYSGQGTRFEVQLATSADFKGQIRWNNTSFSDYLNFNDLEPKTTYFARVQSSNNDWESDYAWTLLGSTLTLRRPLDGAVISSVTSSSESYWGRSMARDSQGALYVAYLKRYFGRSRVFLSKSLDNGRTWADTTLVPIETLGDEGAPNSYDQYSPALAVDSKDGLHLVWAGLNDSMDNSGGNEHKCVYSSAPAGGLWTTPVKIPASPYEGIEGTLSVAVDSKDGVHVLWSGEESPNSSRIRYSSRTASDTAWKPYVAVNDDGKHAVHPALAIDDHDGLHLVAKHAHNVGASGITEDIVYSSRTLSTGWGAWTVIYDGGIFHQGEPTLTIDSGKNLFTAWYSADASNNGNSRIKYAVRPHGGSWGAANYVQAEPTQPQKYPSAAADALGNVYVLWSGSDTLNSAVNLKGSVYNHALTSWDTIDELTDEPSGEQRYVQLRWAGWHNNAGGVDVLWTSYDGVSVSTAELRHMLGSDVYMSPGWSAVEWPLPAQCAFALNVRRDGTGDFTGIQQALGGMPPEISTSACVVVRDTETYSEQVWVAGFRLRSWDTPYARLSIMADPSFISSAPVVTPPQGSLAAFRLETDSVTVQGFTIMSTNTVSYGVLASSEAAVVSSVNVVGRYNGLNTINISGVRLAGRGRVSFSSVTVRDADGITLDGSRSEVSFSTAVSGYNFYSALRLNGSSHTVTRSYFATTDGNAVYLNNSQSNTISLSTMIGGQNNYAGLYLNGSDFNTVSESYMYCREGHGAALQNMSDRNRIENSTMASAGSGAAKALYIYNSSTNTITGSLLINTEGVGASLEWLSGYNTISDSVISASGTFGGAALSLNNADYNSVTRSFLSSRDGNGLEIFSNADNNAVSYTTMTSGGAGLYHAAVYINGSDTTTVVSSYIQGSTAAYLNNSGLAMLRDSVFVATNSVGSGLFLNGATRGLYSASSTYTGGPLGTAVYLGQSNSGKVELSSTAIDGGRYGLYVSAPGPQGRVRVSSMTFRSLIPGATAIYLSGSYDQDNSYFDYVDFASPGLGVNVNGSGLDPYSNVFFMHPEGKWGARYEVDFSNYVNWPTSMARLLWPPDNAVGVPPAPALRAMPEWGSSAAQYRFQVDQSQYIGTPILDFDQSASQGFVTRGVFSGQDGNFYNQGDSFQYTSTATFVFFSTGAHLMQNTQYYWRVAVKTPESGAFGQWSATASFTTGELASLAPVNNLSVDQVNISSPTADGVSVSFRIRENNLLNAVTSGGGAYNTADWIFVKFSTQAGAEGTWKHATLTGGQVDAGATLSAVSDKKGVFVNHAQSAQYWTATATVTWKYGDDGVVGGNAVVKVFAISMVKVPQGQFVYNAGGIGGAAYNNFGGGSQVTVTGPSQLPAGASANWPNGYNSFYIMRYEVTQGLYADFLNTIPDAAAAALWDYQYMFGDRMKNFGAYPVKYTTDDRFAARNYLSTSDLWAFLSWAALRPVTEMEFEKAGRDLAADARTYPWGNTEPDTAVYYPPNEGGAHRRNFMNYDGVSGGQKVLASGRYLSGDVYRTPEQTGASPYGIADLAGNVIEHVVNCSYLIVPPNGNGTTLWPSGWPAANSDQKGWRGGAWFFGAEHAAVSNRLEAGWTSVDRYYYGGGRGARTP